MIFHSVNLRIKLFSLKLKFRFEIIFFKFSFQNLRHFHSLIKYQLVVLIHILCCYELNILSYRLLKASPNLLERSPNEEIHLTKKIEFAL